MKKTFYSGRPVNTLIMCPHTTKKRYACSFVPREGWPRAGFYGDTPGRWRGCESTLTRFTPLRVGFSGPLWHFLVLSTACEMPSCSRTPAQCGEGGTRASRQPGPLSSSEARVRHDPTAAPTQPHFTETSTHGPAPGAHSGGAAQACEPRTSNCPSGKFREEPSW